MLNLSKMLAKFKRYWMEDFDFRYEFRKSYNCSPFTCCKTTLAENYNDLYFENNDWHFIRKGLLSSEEKPNRYGLKICYNFGWRLGANGNIKKLDEFFAEAPKVSFDNSYHEYIFKQEVTIKNEGISISALELEFYIDGWLGRKYDFKFVEESNKLFNLAGYERFLYNK